MRRLTPFLLTMTSMFLISACSMFGQNNGTSASEQTSKTEDVTISDSSANTELTSPTESQILQANSPIEPTQLNQRGKDDFGVITIDRHGPGYNISLILDTGEENVAFVMDLPESEETDDPLGAVAEKLKSMDMGENEQPNSSNRELPIDETTNADGITETTLNPTPSSGMTANDSIVLAQQLFYRRDYLGALNATLQAINQQPEFALAYALKGSIYYKMGRREEAKTAWEQALEIDPNMEDVRKGLEVLFN